MKSFTLALVATLASGIPDVQYESLCSFNASKPNYLSLTKFPETDWFLLFSEARHEKDYGSVYVVPDAADAVKYGCVTGLKQFELHVGHLSWPNNVKAVPQDVFGFNAI